MKCKRLVGRKDHSRSRSWLAVASFAGALMLPVSAWAQFGPTPSFAAAVNFAAQVNPQEVAIANFNDNTDAFLDMAVVNLGSNSVSILLGNGTGGFAAAVNIPLVGATGPGDIATGDVNGDTNVDIVTANDNSTVSVLLGDGLGGFTQLTGPFATGVVSVVAGVAVGEVTGDANLDIVAVNTGTGNISVLSGNGAGVFALVASSPFAVGTDPRDVAIAQLNAAGPQDVIVTNFGTGSISVFLANGGATTLDAAVAFATGAGARNVAVGLLNADAFIDVVVANRTAPSVSVLLGNGAGGFPAGAVNYAAGTAPHDVTIGDFNVDGQPDVAAATLTVPGNVTILNGNGAGVLQATGGTPFPTGGNSIGVSAGLFNGDARLDLAVPNFNDANVSVLLNNLGVSADLSVTKTDGVGVTTETPGTTVTYTITVSNAGPGTLSQLTLIDTLPPALLAPVFTPTTGAYNSGSGAWTGITLAMGGTLTMTLSGTISPTASGTLVNSVTVATIGGDTDPVPGNNTASDTDTLVRLAELTVTKTDSVTTETPGTAVSYTITVSNAGPSTLTQLTLTDTLPAALQTPVFTPTTGAYNSGTGAWTGITLAPGGTVTMTVAGTINAAATGSLVNSVAVAVIGPDTETNTANNTASDTDTLVRLADLSVTKTDGATTETPGTAVSYTMTVSNAGPSTLTQLNLTDTLPAALQTPVFTPTTGVYNSGTGAWTGITLATGGTVTMTLAGTINPAATGNLVNTVAVAVIPPDTETNTANNTASDTDTLSGTGANLAITKTGPATGSVGNDLIYTITVTNNGPQAAATVQVTDVTPTGLTFVSNSGDCVTAFPCALGLVANGATRTITATFSVPANYAGPDPIENVASVSSATTDPDSSDNSASASTSLVGLAFHTVSPCRVLDTRNAANAPALAPGAARTFAIAGACGVPSTAQAVSINVTATQPTDQGDLRIFPAGGATPGTSTINYAAGQTRANNAVVKLGTSGSLSVVTGQASGTVHFILDVNGYFE